MDSKSAATPLAGTVSRGSLKGGKSSSSSKSVATPKTGTSSSGNSASGAADVAKLTVANHWQRRRRRELNQRQGYFR